MCPGGIHLRYGIHPDLAVFAKSIANGYAMAVILGKEKVMQAAQTTFISSTNWTERIGPAAAIATIKKFVKENVDKHIIDVGNKVQRVWKEKAEEHKLNIHVSGIPTLGHFVFNDMFNRQKTTFFNIKMLENGFLGFKQFKPSFAHTDEEVKLYAHAVDKVFGEIEQKDPEKLLSTPVAHDGFYRLTKE